MMKLYIQRMKSIVKELKPLLLATRFYPLIPESPTMTDTSKTLDENLDMLEEIYRPTKLGDKQRVFTRLVGLLIIEAYRLGYELTLGDAYRDPRCPYGHQNSLHRDRLAIDLNLFKDGEWLTETKDHTELGEYWESLHPDCIWGGRFESPDGNHYSYTHNGMR